MNTSLKIYEFSGFGNYSTSFGWDDGLSCTLGESTTFKSALQAEQNLLEYNNLSYGLPETPVKGVYCTFNEYGGNRNIYGYVIAISRRDARKLLAEFEQNWEVVEYERD